MIFFNKVQKFVFRLFSERDFFLSVFGFTNIYFLGFFGQVLVLIRRHQLIMYLVRKRKLITKRFEGHFLFTLIVNLSTVKKNFLKILLQLLQSEGFHWNIEDVVLFIVIDNNRGRLKDEFIYILVDAKFCCVVHFDEILSKNIDNPGIGGDFWLLQLALCYVANFLQKIRLQGTAFSFNQLLYQMNFFTNNLLNFLLLLRHKIFNQCFTQHSVVS